MAIDGAVNLLLKQDSLGILNREAAFSLIDAVSKNQLLSKLIVQATIDADGEYILYPQISRQRIYLGKPENIAVKLDKLSAFYNKIVPVKGWDAYEKIILKFDNQIVCE
jgi:cell division protein FtsQ